MKAEEHDESYVAQWKMKRLIKQLDNAKGNGTSMISLVIKPKEEISRISKMLNEEAGTAVHIKSRVNRLSVLSAITSATQRLKLYTRTPTNGLVVYVGTVLTDDNKERKIAISFEPFKPINTSLYLCDNRFHLEALKELLESDDKFGFIIMCGDGCLFGTLQGNTRAIIQKFSVDLPKKHSRGGQSAQRFSRIRLEKRHNYVRKVAEHAVNCFITNDKPNVSGLVLAGSAEFKTDLAQSEIFDPRLASKIVMICDIAYGGENGFNQAIELSAEALSNVKYVKEKQVLQKMYDHLAKGTGLAMFGLKETMDALEMGVIETLIVWEQLDHARLVTRHPTTGAENVHYVPLHKMTDENLYRDESTGVELEVVENKPLIEWVVDNFKTFGAELEFVSEKSNEGSQYVRGFGGFGGILRYKLEFDEGMLSGDELDEDQFM